MNSKFNKVSKVKVEQVDIFKIACLLAFVIIAVAVIFIAFNRSGDNKIVFKPSKNTVVSNVNAVINPVLHGTDNKNQPYSIMAKKATEVSKNSVEFEDLNAELFSRNNKWFSAIAPKGIMQTNTNTLVLNGLVQVFTGDSEELTTKQMSMNLKNGTIVSNSPVVLKSDRANLTAKNMQVFAAGKKIVFSGNVKMTIYR